MIDDYRLYLHHRWMEGCTNAAALTREIQQLGYRGDINTVRRHLRPYRTGTIPTDAPLPHLTVSRVTDWIMRRPEHLTDTERKCLGELCERSPALATTTEYARRLAAMVRERRSEHLVLDVWLADVRLDGQRELRTLAAGIRRDRAAVLAALTTTFTSGAVEGNVTRIKLLKRQMYGGQLRPPTTPHPPVTLINRLTPPNQCQSPRSGPEPSETHPSTLTCADTLSRGYAT